MQLQIFPALLATEISGNRDDEIQERASFHLKSGGTKS